MCCIFSSWCWILHLFWFGWRVEFADLMGLFRLGIEAGIQFHVEGFSIVAQPPESLVELATWWVIYFFKEFQRQLLSQKAVEACWGYKLAQQVYSSISLWWCFFKQWDVAAGILAGLQKNWAAAHLPKTVEPEVTGKTVRPQRDFGSLAQQLLGHCRRIWGAEVVCSKCKMVRFL